MTETGDATRPLGPDPVSSQSIAPWARWLAASIGISGLIAGGIATFESSAEAGPAALIAVGALFLLVAMSGRLPRRLKFGDNEIDMAAVQEYVEATVQETPPAQRPELLGHLTELAASVPQVAAPALRAVAYEEFALNILSNAARLASQDASIDISSGRGADYFYDVAITGGSWRLFVEVKAGRSTFRRIEEVYLAFASHRSDAPATGLIVVVEDASPRSLLEFGRKHQNARAVIVQSASDADALVEAIRELAGI